MDKLIRKNQIFANYIKVIFAIYSIIIILRVSECFLIFLNYGFRKDILYSEIIGLSLDLLGASIPITIYFIFYFFLFIINTKVLRVVNISLLVITTLISFLIIKYFLYQLIPLDVFLYKYSLREILFTVRTSGTSFVSVYIKLTIIVILISLTIWRLSKVKFNPNSIKITYSFVIVSLLIFLISHSAWHHKLDKFSLNKPFYFINNTLKYVSNTDREYQNLYPEKFQGLYHSKTFISKEYPLVFEVNRENELGKYFNDFESSPNIVMLIVEGLSDDFIHNYKGAVLMPFLNKLKDRSLYWNRCFTLGERSYAVVPSILGGLPYGERGFTLQERLPRHLSLISVLNLNGYFTSFYYGQAAWFHQKDRFFNFNDIDLIYDNTQFPENYDKIIVGNFFWGYNDKDLFNQSLKVLDKLKQNKRLDIYYTGTSHSPFVITDEDYYNTKLKEYTTEPYQDFYNNYANYLKTVMFVDDALKDFFSKYEQRQDYKNTIFIITGDHPMTEIPIENSLKRYHVPLIIFSDNIKENKTFSNIVSHLDVPETILSFLQDYIAYIPTISTSLGSELLPQNKVEDVNIAFMEGNRAVVDFLSGDYFLSDKKLYKIDNALNIAEVFNDSVKNEISYKLNIFNNTSLYVCKNNKIISGDMYCKALNLQNLHTYNYTDKINVSSEYFNIVNKIQVPNFDFTFDMSLNVKSKTTDGISIVYQISNSKNSLLLWKNFGVNKDKITQAHIKINQIPFTDSILYFQSYIWNPKKNHMELSDIDVLLYTSKRKTQKQSPGVK